MKRKDFFYTPMPIYRFIRKKISLGYKKIQRWGNKLKMAA